MQTANFKTGAGKNQEGPGTQSEMIKQELFHDHQSSNQKRTQKPV